jgi:hypothetical protein
MRCAASRAMPDTGPIHSAATTPARAGGTPVDHTSEAPAIGALERRGFTATFVADGDRLRLAGTARRFRPEDVRIVDFYRFEGTSDPDDMSVVYALQARDGTRGVLTDAFGSYADPVVGALVERMTVERPPTLTRRRTTRPAWLAASAALVLVGIAGSVWRGRLAAQTRRPTRWHRLTRLAPR